MKAYGLPIIVFAILLPLAVAAQDDPSANVRRIQEIRAKRDRGEPLSAGERAFARGAVQAPVLLWGPYLWACGNRPRKFDGLVWSAQDVRSDDHMHPSESGCKKVAAMLLQFLKTDPGARGWFVKHFPQP